MSTITLPAYETGKHSGAEAAFAWLAESSNTSIADLCYWANTHRVENLAVVAVSYGNFSYEGMQEFKAGYITGYQGAMLSAIQRKAEDLATMRAELERMESEARQAAKQAEATACELCPGVEPGVKVRGTMDPTGDETPEPFDGYLCEQHIKDAYWSMGPVLL